MRAFTIILCAFALACSGSTSSMGASPATGGEDAATNAGSGGRRSSDAAVASASGGTGPARGGGGVTGRATGGSGASADAGERGGSGGRSRGGAGGMTGASGRTGASGAAGRGAAGSSSMHPTASDLPAPPGAADRSKPSGTAANLKVLDWAGWKSALSYSFDDSQPSQIAHYAELDATGVRVTFYLTTSNNGTANYDATWKGALARGHELGNHTVHHCNYDLSNCNAPLGTIDAEIDQCTGYIEQLGASVTTIAYPYGDTGYEDSARMRFFLGRGVGGGVVLPGDSTDPFNLPVKAANGGEAASVFSQAIDDARGQGGWLIFLFHSLLPTDQNWYAGVDIGGVTTSIAHAQTLADVWIDSVSNVGAYWLGQKLVAGAIASTNGGAMTWSWQLPAHFPKGRFVRVTVDGGTLQQDGTALAWDGHGYYEVALDAQTLRWSP